MDILLLTIGSISLALATWSIYAYMTHPLAGSRFLEYRGGKFWIIAFICFLAYYFKH